MPCWITNYPVGVTDGNKPSVYKLTHPVSLAHVKTWTLKQKELKELKYWTKTDSRGCKDSNEKTDTELLGSGMMLWNHKMRNDRMRVNHMHLLVPVNIALMKKYHVQGCTLIHNSLLSYLLWFLCNLIRQEYVRAHWMKISGHLVSIFL